MPPANWKKSSADLVERFAAALPRHPDLVRKPMFGYPAAFVHGNMICGLFQESVVARLGKEGAAEAVAAGEATPFAPMPGRIMTGYVLIPTADAENPEVLSTWLQRALDFTLTLPRKPAKVTAAKATSAKSSRK